MLLRCVAFLLCLSACAPFPEIGGSVAEGPYPTLAPIDTLLDAPEPQATPEEATNLANDADNLRARAERLRRPVLTRAERARLTGGVRRPF